MVVDDVNGLEDANLEQSSKNDEIEVTNVADYHGFSVSELIAELEKFCTKDLVEAHRKEIEEIRSLFYKKQKNETEEARKAYIEEHGDISGFVYETKENEFKEETASVSSLKNYLPAARREVLSLSRAGQYPHRHGKVEVLPRSEVFAVFRGRAFDFCGLQMEDSLSEVSKTFLLLQKTN